MKIQTPPPCLKVVYILIFGLFVFWRWPPPLFGIFPQFCGIFNLECFPYFFNEIYPFLMQICQFRCLSLGSTAIQMFSISKMSNIAPRGGVSFFQKCLKFKKVWNIRWGGGVKPNWEFFPNFSVFLLWDIYRLKIWQVPTCKMEPRSGIISCNNSPPAK